MASVRGSGGERRAKKKHEKKRAGGLVSSERFESNQNNHTPPYSTMPTLNTSRPQEAHGYASGRATNAWRKKEGYCACANFHNVSRFGKLKRTGLFPHRRLHERNEADIRPCRRHLRVLRGDRAEHHPTGGFRGSASSLGRPGPARSLCNVVLLCAPFSHTISMEASSSRAA